MKDLLGYREIVEKNGLDLDEIFFVTSFERLWKHDYGYTVQAHQSGNGNFYFSETFKALEDAQKVYDTVKGVIAHKKGESLWNSYRSSSC